MIATPRERGGHRHPGARGIGSRMRNQASSAARNGEMAWNSSTWATLVWSSARMKQHETIASSDGDEEPGASDAAEGRDDSAAAAPTR